jgi:TP901 family phage tail tape measure protein
MSNRQIEAILKISAKMGNTSALRTLERQMARVSKQATAFNRANAFAARHAQGAWARTTRTLAPIAAAYGGVASVRNYAAVERQVGRIGATAEASLAQTESAMVRLRSTASELRMPFQEVVGGLDSLVAAGRNLDEGLSFLPAVGKAAQASGADIRDMATTADSISGSLGITADRMQSAFDILAYGGKAGKFELKDMASELPSLAPAFAALGYKGEEGLKRLVTMLQVVRMETGTSGEAATSFMDVISKMESETVSNNFKKFGLNIRKEMDVARKSGEDVLEAFTRLSIKAVKGDLSKLPRLFTDKQMLIGMRAIINNADQGRTLLGQMGDAAGTVQRNFERFSKDTQSSIDNLSNSFDRLAASAGKSIASMGAAKGMDAVSEGMDKATAINSQLEKEGYSWLGARGWWAKNGFDTGSQDSKAWQGGFRSPQDIYQIEGYRASAKARTGETAVTPDIKRDKKDMPVAGPIPQFRDAPDKQSTEIDAALARKDLAAQYAAAGKRYSMPRVTYAGEEMMQPIGAAAGRDPSQSFDWRKFLLGDMAEGKTFKDAMRVDTRYGGKAGSSRSEFATADAVGSDATNRRHISDDTRKDGGPSSHSGDIGKEIETAFSAGGKATGGEIRDAAQSVNQAGQDAGSYMEKAAQTINQAGMDAGSHFATMMQGLGQKFGADAAASFRASIGNITVNAKVTGAGATSGGGSVNADVGRAGSDIGRTGPQ